MKKHIMKHFQLAILAVALSGCAGLPDNLVSAPQVSLKNVQVVGLGFESQTFLLSFDVVNANAFPLPVNNVTYGLRLDGQRFASGETVSDFTIPANGRTGFAISVNLNLLQTAPQLLAIVRDSSRRDVRYDIDGRLGVDIPLTGSLKYRNSGLLALHSN